MPNRDGTGPQGKGPKTGRGNGRCGQQSFNNQSDVQSQKDCGRGRGKQPCGNMATDSDDK